MRNNERKKQHENSMKKLLAVLMAATMMIAFGACGGSESGTDGSADEGPRVLKMSHHIAETDSSAILAEKFAELVNEKSGGKLKIEIYGNGQLYGQADALEALKMGSLDLAMSDTSLYSIMIRVAAFSTCLMFSSQENRQSMLLRTKK